MTPADAGGPLPADAPHDPRPGATDRDAPDAGGRVPSGATLLRLMWLASPALPVGGFSYSEGLEAAVEAGLVTDEAAAAAWLADQLHLTLARSDLPVLLRAVAAWRTPAPADAVARLNGWVRRTRESSELRRQTEQMGRSLADWLRNGGSGAVADGNAAVPEREGGAGTAAGASVATDGEHPDASWTAGTAGVASTADDPAVDAGIAQGSAGVGAADGLPSAPRFGASAEASPTRPTDSHPSAGPPARADPRVALLAALAPAPTWPIAFALAAAQTGAAPRDAAFAHAFGWAETMVQAAMKTVPLGQAAGQRILGRLAGEIPAAVETAEALAADGSDEALQAYAPMLAVLSARHEAQYSRLFRS